MDENAKKRALLMIPYGLFVLGAKHGATETVSTINWVTQASFNPPLVAIGIKKDSGTHALVKDSGKFSLSVLGTGQKAIAAAFFRHVEPKEGKFGNYAYEAGETGLPIVSEAPAAVECEVVGFYELGDHSLAVGKVVAARFKQETEVLTLKETGWNYGG